MLTYLSHSFAIRSSIIRISAAELERASAGARRCARDGLHPLTDNLRAVHAPGVYGSRSRGLRLKSDSSRASRAAYASSYTAPHASASAGLCEIGIVRCIRAIPVGLGGAVRSSSEEAPRTRRAAVRPPGSLRRVVHRDHRLLHSRELLSRLNLSQLDPSRSSPVVQPPEALELERVGRSLPKSPVCTRAAGSSENGSRGNLRR